MAHRKLPIGTLIALAATGLFLTILTSSTIISGVVISSQAISSGGTITSMNVEIFNNNDCTQFCNNINWGALTPGDSITQTIYIKNSGNKRTLIRGFIENNTNISGITLRYYAGVGTGLWGR